MGSTTDSGQGTRPVGREFAGEVMIFHDMIQYEGVKETKERLDDIEAELYSIRERINGNPALADFKSQVESVKKRIVELRTYVGV